jgi:flagellar biosynthesis protein FlhF
MNTGQGSKSSHTSEALPFAAEVYRTSEPARQSSEIDELRVEMRNEVRALRAHVTRAGSAGTLDLGREIATLRAMLSEIAPPPAPAKRGDRIATFMRTRGIEGAAAARITARAKESLENDPLPKLRGALAELIPLAPWNDRFEGRRIVAAIGPSGVGKTTTVAKLAARARVEGKSVALVSCDGFRVGAVDQLERYADLLGATFHVARSSAELAAVLEVETADVVFVDTSGRPPSATAPEAALAARRKKDAPVPVEVLLCVPASIRAADAARTMAIFAPLTPTAVCVTKLDETDAPSGLVHGPWAAQVPLAVICTGPRVPEDVAPATSEAFNGALGLDGSIT